MRKATLLLCVLLLLAFLLRLYRFDNPIADWHAWRQADTSSVSRIFVQEGFDFLHPRFHDLSNVPSGIKNPSGYRFVEFPLYNLAQAGMYVLFDVFTLEQWGRIVTISASLGAVIFIYLIVTKHSDSTVGLLSAFFLAVLPFSVYYGRTILPDPSMVTAVLGGIYFFDLWLEKKAKHTNLNLELQLKPSILFRHEIKHYLFFILSVVFSAASLLLKPFAIFFFLPLFVLAYNFFRFSFFKKWQLWVFAILTVTPFILWRWWMQQYPQGIPASSWLFNAGNIRFTGAFFYWIFADRLGRLILGYFGIAILGFGILTLASKKFFRDQTDRLFFLSFIVSSLLYVFVIARGNVQHDYYQILLLPTIAIMLGFGSAFLFRPPEGINKAASVVFFFICTLGMLAFSWYHVRDFFNVNNPNIVIAGQAVDRLTPKDAKVIALYNGDTSFLYQTKRKGWASLQESLDKMIAEGANYLVIVNPTPQDFSGFGRQYPIVGSSKAYLILRLTNH